MDSPGHRKNILEPNFTEIGVGLTSGPNGPEWVQEFGADNTPPAPAPAPLPQPAPTTTPPEPGPVAQTAPAPIARSAASTDRRPRGSDSGAFSCSMSTGRSTYHRPRLMPV